MDRKNHHRRFRETREKPLELSLSFRSDLCKNVSSFQSPGSPEQQRHVQIKPPKTTRWGGRTLRSQDVLTRVWFLHKHREAKNRLDVRLRQKPAAEDRQDTQLDDSTLYYGSVTESSSCRFGSFLNGVWYKMFNLLQFITGVGSVLSSAPPL